MCVWPDAASFPLTETTSQSNHCLSLFFFTLSCRVCVLCAFPHSFHFVVSAPVPFRPALPLHEIHTRTHTHTRTKRGGERERKKKSGCAFHHHCRDGRRIRKRFPEAVLCRMSVPSALVRRQLTRKEIHFYVNTLIIELTKKEFQEKLREEAVKEPIPLTGEELLDRFDEVQAEFFNTVPLKVPADESCEGPGDVANGNEDGSPEDPQEKPPKPEAGEATKVIYCDGEDVVAQTKVAAKSFPDKETERLLTRMCTALEAQVLSVSTSAPELRSIAEQMSGGSAMSGHPHSHDHQHSHGGQPCTHGHSHGKGAMPTPEMRRMMEMSMGTLSADQKATLERVQKKMSEGSPPSAEDMQKMAVIQQHVMAFMTTMEQFMGGGAAGGRGRGAGGHRGA